jgi:hypothetical protein
VTSFADPVPEQALPATETWFVRRGLPLLVEDYSASTDVWTRALPALIVGFVFLIVSGHDELRVELNLDESGLLIDGSLPSAGDLLRSALLLLLLVAAFVIWNVLRGRRAFARPSRVGPGVLAVFVLVPAVLALLTGQGWAAAAATAVLGAVLLAIIYVVTRYAGLALLWWVLRWTFTQLGDVYRLSTRALPLMLLFITFLFVNTEVWQVAGTMQGQVLWATLAVFAGLGILFLAGRVGEEVDEIEVGTDRDVVLAAAAGGPLAQAVGSLPDLDRPVPLRRAQRANLGLVLVSAQLIQVALIGVIVWAFFLLVGALAISLQVQQQWLGTLMPVEVVVPFGDEHGLTRPLLRVATFLGGFAAFYAMVYAATDQVYREHFFAGIGAHLRRSLAVRRGYLAVRRSVGLPAPGPVPAAGPTGGPVLTEREQTDAW